MRSVLVLKEWDPATLLSCLVHVAAEEYPSWVTMNAPDRVGAGVPKPWEGCVITIDADGFCSEHLEIRRLPPLQGRTYQYFPFPLCFSAPRVDSQHMHRFVVPQTDV